MAKNPNDSKSSLLVGYFALIILIAGLGYWSISTPISGAVVATGILEVKPDHHAIQHPTGGIVKYVHVRNGAHVQTGDVLIELEDTRAREKLNVIESQLFQLQTSIVRLVSERDQMDKIAFPEEFLNRIQSHQEFAQHLANEQKLFAARQAAFEQETGQLNEQLIQLGHRIDGVNYQISAQRAQLAYVGDELSMQQVLLKNGNSLKGKVLSLRSKEALINGQIGKLSSDVFALRKKIAEISLELIRLPHQRTEKAIIELRKLQEREEILSDQHSELTDRLSRLEIIAPISGVIHESQEISFQSVLGAGDIIMYIIPQGAALVAHVQIKPINVDELYLAQNVKIRFSAFDQRQTPDVSGTITHISADVSHNSQTGTVYYSVEVAPDFENLTEIGMGKLLPGMPVETYFLTQERTVFALLTSPITDYFSRALRE